MRTLVIEDEPRMLDLLRKGLYEQGFTVLTAADGEIGLELAMAHAKRAQATLVIAKIDRLSRNVAFLSGLMESGVKFVACDMPSADHFQVHIMVALAQKEAEMISQRTKEGMAALKARGYYSLKKQRVVTIGKNNFTPEHLAAGRAAGVAVIRRNRAEAYAFVSPIVSDMRAQGASFAAIAAHLNDIGETTRTGKPWNAMQVRRVLAAASLRISRSVPTARNRPS